MSPRKRLAALAALLVAVVVVAVIVVRPKTSTPHSANLSKSAVAAALAGSPAVLSSLHAQGNQLLSGGTTAFKARLKALRGHPVVINEWASWCEPCQSEFPVFQRVAVHYGRQVAFIGLDAHDTNGAADAFLRRFPVSYPSYVDPSQRIGSLLQAVGGIPQTVYINAQGKQVFDHAGPYETAASLETDIKRYVIQ
ncbi:MAG TPA: TlpA disulfide reductase family protein [Solirubrobacteraceae bacterium]|nr:TlpA disulfide reductase family protein [Solirubrobacteraceae bacterium]